MLNLVVDNSYKDTDTDSIVCSILNSIIPKIEQQKWISLTEETSNNIINIVERIIDNWWTIKQAEEAVNKKYLKLSLI